MKVISKLKTTSILHVSWKCGGLSKYAFSTWNRSKNGKEAKSWLCYLIHKIHRRCSYYTSNKSEKELVRWHLTGKICYFVTMSILCYYLKLKNTCMIFFWNTFQTCNAYTIHTQCIFLISTIYKVLVEPHYKEVGYNKTLL